MVRMGDGFLVAPVGPASLSNLFVAEATMQELVLTNTTGQTNRSAVEHEEGGGGSH